MADHKSLAEALAAFQAEVPKMSKDEKANPNGGGKKWDYAALDQFVEVVEPVLGKHGLSVTGVTTWQDSQFAAEISLLHESGEKMTSTWPLPDPRKVGPQDIGSALTYARRYLGWLMSGTFPGGIDDDGQKAQQSARNNWDTARTRENRPVSAPPVQQAGPTDAKVLEWITPLPTAEIGQALAVYDWMHDKGLHRRVVQMDYRGTMVAVTAAELMAGRIADEAARDGATLDEIKALEKQANERNLMKIEVGDQETLAQALMMAQDDIANAAPVQNTQERLNEEQGS